MKPIRRTIEAALSAAIILYFVALPVDLGLAQQIPHQHIECRKIFKQFQTKPKHRAFAVTNMSEGTVKGIACAWAAGYPSKAAAEAAAIGQCQKSAGPCSIKESD